MSKFIIIINAIMNYIIKIENNNNNNNNNIVIIL